MRCCGTLASLKVCFFSAAFILYATKSASCIFGCVGCTKPCAYSVPICEALSSIISSQILTSEKCSLVILPGAVNLHRAYTLCRQFGTCLKFCALHGLPNNVDIGMPELLLLSHGMSSHVFNGHFSFFTFVHRL